MQNFIEISLFEFEEWKKVNSIETSPEFTKTLDESLDSSMFKIKFTERSNAIKNFTKCRVKFFEQETETSEKTLVETRYYYAKSTVEQRTLKQPYLYDHSVNLVEPTKILEGIFIGGMGVTQPLPGVAKDIKDIPDDTSWSTADRQTIQYFQDGVLELGYSISAHQAWWLMNNGYDSPDDINKYLYKRVTIADTVERLLAVTPLRRLKRSDSEFDEQQRFVLDRSIKQKLNSIISPEFKFTQKMTLFECLDEIGQFIGAMPRLVPSSIDDSNYNTLTYDWFEVIGNNIEKLKYSAYQEDFDENNYCTELETYAENLICQSSDSQSSIVYPANNGWITPRSDEIRVTDDNCFIELPYPIYKLLSVKVTGFNIKISYKHTPSDDEWIHENISFDNTKFLDISSAIKTKEAHCLLDYKNYLSPTPTIEEKIVWLTKHCKTNTFWYEQGSNKLGGFENFKNQSIFDITGSCIEKAIQASLNRQGDKVLCEIDTYWNQHSIKPSKVKFQIEYIPLTNAKLTAKEQIVNKINAEPFSRSFSQLSEVNDSQSLGNNMWGKVQRMGLSQTTVVVYLDSLSQVPKIGDIWQEKMVTTIKTVHRADHIVAVLGLSKDFNKLSGRIGVSSKYRQWRIPSDSLKRSLHYDEYIVVNYWNYPNTSILRSDGVLAFANTFETTKHPTSTEIDCATFHGNKNNEWLQKVLLSCSSLSFGKSMAFVWSMKDNYSAGQNKTGDVIGDVAYADSRGIIDFAGVDFGNTINDGYNPDELPACTTGINPLFRARWDIRKDPCEHLECVYQMHFVAANNKIIIGNRLAHDCTLVKESEEKQFKLWNLSKPLRKFDNVMFEENGVVVDDGFFVAPHSTPADSTCIILNIPVHEINAGWCITDMDNNILIGVNDKKKVLHFSFRNNLENII